MTRKSTRFSMGIVSLTVAAGMVLSACGAATPTAVPLEPTATTMMEQPTATTMMEPTKAMMEPTKAMMEPTKAMMEPTKAMAETSVTGGGGVSGDTIKIGIDLPLSGADASVGLPTRNGMQLAIDQANKNGGVTINGKQYKLEAYVLDDVPPGANSHDPAQSSKNSDSFISDNSALVVLGPFNSSNAQAMMPKLNTAGLCQISPSNTNETLTKPEFGKTKDYRPTGKVTYFRVAATDDVQGPAAADYAYDKLNLKKVYILDDTETYGKGIADNFEKEFKSKGGTVLGHDGVPAGTSDFSSIMTKVAAQGPDFIYYGGTSSNGIPQARKQMKSAGLDVPLMGGDGLVDGQFLDVAGVEGINTYGTVAAVNVDVLPEAKQFIQDYTAANFKEPIGSYSGPGYETAKIAIDAMSRANSATREGVCEALRNTKNYKGVLGETSFDENGDTTNQVISFYQVKAGKDGAITGKTDAVSWYFLDQIRFGNK